MHQMELYFLPNISSNFCFIHFSTLQMTMPTQSLVLIVQRKIEDGVVKETHRNGIAISGPPNDFVERNTRVTKENRMLRSLREIHVIVKKNVLKLSMKTPGQI